MRKFSFLLPAVLLLSIFISLGGRVLSVKADELPLSSGGPDIFGYIWNNSLPYAWIDNTGATNAGFNGVDDGFIGPIAIGFSFKFYENSYTQLYISTNGLLTFGQGSTIFDNKPVPRTVRPDNFLAPFWDDLAVGGSYNSGKVYFGQGMSGGKKYFAVEWNGVTRAGNTTDPITFEAILYDDGGVCYQYKDLRGNLDSATVGIEDGDGVDGLLYLFNSPGINALETTHALCFQRPAPGPRAKILPVYQSKLIQNHLAEFSILVRNTGESGSDIYALITSASGSSWPVSFFASDHSPLTDTNSDGIVDTGAVAQGETKTIFMQSQAPPGALVGDYSLVNLTVRSTLNPSKSATALLQSAIPAPFVQIYDTNQVGMYLHVAQPDVQSRYKAVADFTGSTMTLAALHQGNYMFAWERHGFNGNFNYSDIEFLIMNSFGQLTRRQGKLTNNAGATQYVADLFPSVAVLPDSKIGVTWVRNIINASAELNSNIYLAILDPSGSILQGPINVTQNSGWHGIAHPEVPSFNSPRLAAASASSFLIAWADDRMQGVAETNDISYAIFGTNGSFIKTPSAFTHSNQDGTRNLLPVLVELSNSKTLLAYSVESVADPTNKLTYAVLDGTGNVLKNATTIADSNGWNADGIQLSTGEVIFAWTSLADNRIWYVMLSGSAFDVMNSPVGLDSPFPRQADYVSVTADDQGHAVLSWIDSEQNNYLFYAMIGGDGTVLTPPMVFDTGLGAGPFVLTSSVVGGGNAPYQPGETLLPCILRK
jgi:hypothetical protein